ncbi:phosphatase PAP2 family protein [Streptomyces anandii]|uniref:phosphatase PAP2 family protein n=1 Tax=Streptomyces anandii TaxID=285454 RepID=UPI0036BF33C2
MLRASDRRLIQRLAAGTTPGVHRLLSVVEECAEGTKLWCGASVVLATAGGRRGRRAAAAAMAALTVAQTVSNGLCKHLVRRPRPPKEWVPHDEVEDRPESSSFPSGHTAAAAAFTAAVFSVWPLAGVLCAVPAALVAVERVQSGAHYPTDVAAGAVIGLGSAWIVRHGPEMAKARRFLSLPLSTYSAPGGLRQGPGRGAESSAEPATCENGGDGV